MTSLYYVVLLCGVIAVKSASIHNGGEITREKRQSIDIDGYLEQFGYMEKSYDPLRDPINRDEASRRAAIREFQNFNGLQVTGVINEETILKMRQPRCGVTDKPAIEAPSGDNRPMEFNAPGNKWKRNSVTWNILNPSAQLSEDIQKVAIRNALKYWSDVTPLQFPESTGKPDIEIQFAVGNHGDGRGNAFDGNGGVLAHAYLPGSYLEGDTHFDEGERWVFQSNSGTELETVAAHEFGHALGLGHSRNPAALMAPYYRGYIPGMRLHDDDVRGIQSLYGGPINRPTTSTPATSTTSPTTTPPPTTPSPKTPVPTTPSPKTPVPTTPSPKTPVPTTPGNEPRPRGGMCDLDTFDAITLGPDGATYVFRNQFVYKVTSEGLEEGYPRFIRDVYRGYPHAPRYVQAAVYLQSTGETFLFNNHGKVWRYKGFTLQNSTRMDNIDFRSAITLTNSRYGNQQIYLFGTNYFWSLNRWTMNVARRSGYPLPIPQFWGNFPRYSTAAIEWTDGNMYFFKRGSYVRMSPRTRNPIPGPTDDSAAAWLTSLCIKP